MPSYLVVFHANIDPKFGLIDIGDDPCFDIPPSWGICRPNIRRSVEIGTNLFFIGYVGPNQYFVKGWFEVGEKISYVEAHRRFPDRANVIISPLPNDQTLHQVIQNRQVKWRYTERRKAFKARGLSAVPGFLYMTLTSNQLYVQNFVDQHEIDSWKCNRIFLCRTNQFIECINNNTCLKEGHIFDEHYHNYIIARADCWIDVGRLQMNWSEVEDRLRLGVSLRTPKGQHNVRRLTDVQTQRLIEFLLQAN